MKKNDRMLELVKSLEQDKKEVIKHKKNVINEHKIKKENNRFRNLISRDTNSEFKNENYYIAGKFGTGGRAQTVNSIVDSFNDVDLEKTPKVNPSNLKPEEALDICIKRVLKSGSPINNISFYDEINWNLMNLGFPAVNEIDIKNAILKNL